MTSEAGAAVTELEELATDIEHITDEESERLAGESRAARTVDQQLAGDARARAGPRSLEVAIKRPT